LTPATFYRKHRRILLAIIATCLGLVVFFGVKAYSERPQDLGSGLEYIGKSDYGCLFICDSAPASSYYFATDMNKEELTTYFKGATFEASPATENGGGSSSDGSRYWDMYFETNANNDTGFYLTYYEDAVVRIDRYNLKRTDKSHVLSMPGSAYLTAKDSLN
jgi:hypothetical protein